MTGTMMPKRSDNLPIRMLDTPKHTIVSVYGNDAAPRATPNSACTVGSATTTDHMPTPPIVDSTSETISRIHASPDSTCPYNGRASLLTLEGMGIVRSAASRADHIEIRIVPSVGRCVVA